MEQFYNSSDLCLFLGNKTNPMDPRKKKIPVCSQTFPALSTVGDTGHTDASQPLCPHKICHKSISKLPCSRGLPALAL